LGATSIAQLENDIEAATMTLSPELLARIEAVHDGDPNPCP